ncbi:CD47 protein, partial [Rostratula benghalensis]|nr:CD47 protein [Rostratula benghalensis]
GSAQLLFNATDVVTKTDCNETVILPCLVLNLHENDATTMFVTWKRREKIIFSYDGARKETFRDQTVPSANLVSEADLHKGIASLRVNSAEAEVGNYTCEVTESNREGETSFELKKYPGSWFLLLERAIIISLLFSIIFLFSVQLTLIGKYWLFYSLQLHIYFKIICICALHCKSRISVLLISIQMFTDGYTVQNQTGLGLIVVPAVIFVPLQYLKFGMVFDGLPQAAYVLVGLQFLGYVIAVAGFVLCVS